MLRGLVLALLFAAVGANAQLTRPVAATQPVMNFGGAVLPQNYMQPVAGQLNAPVLTPQQAMNLIPIDQLQTALNQRVAALGQVGQPYVQTTQQPIGFGMGAQPIQQQPIGIQQQLGLTQQPIGLGFGGLQTQQPMGFGLGGVQQQQPMGFGLGGVQQQQPMGFGLGGVQQPYGLGVGVQQPVGFGLGQQQQIPLGMGVGGFQTVQQPIIPMQQQPLGFGGVQAQQPIGWAQQQQPVFLQQGGMAGPAGMMGPM